MPSRELMVAVKSAGSFGRIGIVLPMSCVSKDRKVLQSVSQQRSDCEATVENSLSDAAKVHGLYKHTFRAHLEALGQRMRLVSEAKTRSCNYTYCIFSTFRLKHSSWNT